MQDKLELDVQRGIQAENLMTNRLMVEAREHIDAELWRLFRATPPTDIEALSQIKSMEYMHAKYQAFLKQVLQDGKFAKLEIERKKKTLKERFLG